MTKLFLRHSKTALTAITATRSLLLPQNQLFSSSSSSSAAHLHRQPNLKPDERQASPKSPIGSPCRVQKLIASQSDPLLAKEIFDYASRFPNFQHSYSSYLILILKLGRAKYFSLIDNLLLDLKSKHYPVTSTLFSYLIKTYGEANLPEKVLKTFYTMLHFNFKPLPKHLNLILEFLVSNKNYVKPAFDLFSNAHRYGVEPDKKSYNILMRVFCLRGELSIAYKLFNQMFKRDVLPDIESYRILMQGLCRKSQVNGAVDLLEDMLNKGYVPDTLTYTTLLNSLCRKKKLREAYKLLCRMKVKGCNPDIVHFNTVILGFCREGRAMDACKVLEDMNANGCLPNLVSYRTLVGGLCDQGMLDEAKSYLVEMMSKGFSPHFSVSHALGKGFCNVGKVEEAYEVVEQLLKHGEAPHVDTWMIMVPRICEVDDLGRIYEVIDKIMKIEIRGDTKIVDAGIKNQLTRTKMPSISTPNGSLHTRSQEEDDSSSPPAAASVSSPKTLSSSIKFGTPEALDHVRNLTDVGAMTRLLHECIAYQRALDLNLDNLLAQRADLDKNLTQLQKSAEVLDIVKSDSDHMLNNVRSTCDLADHVSAKVRELDLAQSRVNVALSRIDAIVERGNCIDGVKNALESEDYEAAANYVQTFLQIDAKYKDSGSDQRQQLLDSKKHLEGIVRRRLSAAVDQRDHQTILRFIRLFPPLGLEEEGLQVYVGYLKKVISMRSRLEFEQLVELMDQINNNNVNHISNSRVNFVMCLTNLFKDIVLAIEENDGILRSLCGEDAIVYAICELQEECDSRGSLILKKYMEYRKLAMLSSEINAQSKNLLNVGAPEGPDPREVELYLEEILSLMQLGEDYTEFMVSKIKGLTSVDPELVPRATKSFRSGSFSKVVQEIIGFYVILERFFMVENIKKAIAINEPVPDSLTTSMIDDVFFVLQSCSRRALSTSNISSVIAVLSGASAVLSNDFFVALQEKMRELNPGAKLFVAGVGVQRSGTEIATALNNIDVSSEYVLKLKHEIEEQCAEVFPAPADREKVKSCLSELGDMSNTFKQALNAGMEQLVATVTQRIRQVLDSVTTISYELSETEYADNEVNDPWVQRLLHAVETNVSWLQPVMTGNNYDSFVHLVIDYLVKRLEVIMMQKRFNQLGGLQLDRDIRALVSHFSGMTQRTVRDKFARLTQMATILNLEKVSEILDFWGENSGPMTWRLTPAEVRRVLGLRIEFKPEAISALKL
ncbi:conserved oligomeric Golgi complex subunit 4 [Mercurialis annua]|uniref:conserved oligomeric Golgi complex subunit 4 n=1 Tax=Mercurialis annua TaxID=3986 RepID=UPI00215EBF6D|nr:conserved oligomeric Golgi complex subunit 4 [Mercurialis annua]